MFRMCVIALVMEQTRCLARLRHRSNYQYKHTWPNQTTEIIVDKAGDWEVRESLTHAVENAGENVIHSLIFEFKKAGIQTRYIRNQKSSDTDTLRQFFHHGAFYLVADNSFTRAYDVKFKPHQNVAYWHPPALLFLFSDTLTVKTEQAGCEAEIRLAPKMAYWFEAGVWEVVNNGGDIEPRLLVLELKGEEW